MQKIVSIKDGEYKVTVSRLKDGRYSMGITQPSGIHKVGPFHLSVPSDGRFDEAERDICQKLAKKWMAWSKI